MVLLVTEYKQLALRQTYGPKGPYFQGSEIDELAKQGWRLMPMALRTDPRMHPPGHDVPYCIVFMERDVPES